MVNNEGNPIELHSIAAGLDYPGISPQHAFLKDTGRATYFPVTAREAVSAFKLLSEFDGITPAIESSHAVALAVKVLKGNADLAIINLWGRGDNDVERSL